MERRRYHFVACAAQKAAMPGDVMLLHPGRYEGPFVFNRSGAPGKPIVWRGLLENGKGPVVDGMQPGDRLNGAAIDASAVHDVWFEQLEIANAWTLLKANESSNIVVRHCHLHDGMCGIVASRNTSGNVRNFFICDNLIEGTMPWPVTPDQWKELPESRAIWITGSGHDIGFNRIRHMKDGFDLDESPSCFDIDFHNNDVSEMFDDGAALDGSERNTRCFLNRFTDVRQGISFQPVFGGPAYAFRNVIYNVQIGPLQAPQRRERRDHGSQHDREAWLADGAVVARSGAALLFAQQSVCRDRRNCRRYLGADD